MKFSVLNDHKVPTNRTIPSLFLHSLSHSLAHIFLFSQIFRLNRTFFYARWKLRFGSFVKVCSREFCFFFPPFSFHFTFILRLFHLLRFKCKIRQHTICHQWNRFEFINVIERGEQSRRNRL